MQQPSQWSAERKKIPSYLNKETAIFNVVYKNIVSQEINLWIENLSDDFVHCQWECGNTDITVDRAVQTRIGVITGPQ